MSTNRELFNQSKRYLLDNKINLRINLVYELLVEISHYKSYTDLIVHFDDECKNEEGFLDNFKKLVNGQPLQYIINKAYFVGMEFYVDNNVLIPRPETEGLVTIVQRFIDENQLNHNVIVDMCTGSGCIACYMKKSFPESIIYGIDLYPNVINVARKNSENLNLDVNYLIGDKCEPLIKNHIKCDVFLSNPPYIKNVKDIDKIVYDNEALVALVAKNGIDFYEDFFANYKEITNDKFVMAFEINYDQKNELTDLIHKYFKNDNTTFVFLKDIYEKDRYLIILGGYPDVSYIER